jgi:hypothetical protein
MQKCHLLKLLQESGKGGVKKGWGGEFMHDIFDTFNNPCQCHNVPTPITTIQGNWHSWTFLKGGFKFFRIYFWFLLYYLFIYLFLLLFWMGGIVAFTKFLKMYQIYHTLIQPLHHSPLSSFSPILGIVSAGIIFAFISMYTQYLGC